MWDSVSNLYPWLLAVHCSLSTEIISYVVSLIMYVIHKHDMIVLVFAYLLQVVCFNRERATRSLRLIFIYLKNSIYCSLDLQARVEP